MKKMACIAIAAVLIAAAAADGAFVGISLGRTQSKAKITNDTNTFSSSAGLVTNKGYWDVDQTTGQSFWVDTSYAAQLKTQLDFLQSSDSHDTKGEMSYGILAGYRWFLGENFAVRGLAEFDYQPAKLKGEIPGSNKLNAMLFIVGADVLGYFNRSDSAQFGVFAGIGVAYHRYDLKLDFLDKQDFDSFGFMANLGLHADIAQNHGIELGARFFTNEAKGDSTIFQNANNSASFSKYDVSIKQKPAFFLRYIYQF